MYTDSKKKLKESHFFIVLCLVHQPLFSYFDGMMANGHSNLEDASVLIFKLEQSHGAEHSG